MPYNEQLAAVATQVATPSRASSPVLPSVGSTGYGRAALNGEIAKLAATTAGNRNNQLFQSAAALFGLVASRALDRGQVWNTLLSTALSIGLSDAEARRTIESGEKRGINQPRLVPNHQTENGSEMAQGMRGNDNAGPAGNMQVKSVERQRGSKPMADDAARLLIHADELDNLPPIRWLIQDILPANTLVEVHGAPGAGKTQVAFDMAQTLAANGQAVIYVVAEGLQGYRGRKRAWQKFHKLGSGNLFIWSQAVHLFDPTAVQTFLQVVQPKQPNLIVFDTLSRCSLGADENNQKDMNFILDALDRIRRETGATVVAVHHTNAAGFRERGSTVIRGGVDVMLDVTKDDDLIVVSSVKMKDALDFDPLYLKPVLVDIGEENPIPVLVPAEKRIQTLADKLTLLQLDILKAIGMEMFAESGIKSSQLDEILPPSTKRASKYHSLNTLIRLGYVKPHTKGDPYHITDEGRQKLSNTELQATSSKSDKSKAGPGMFIWTLPESCPMSSPVPHSQKCGTDETLDTKQQTVEIDEPTQPANAPSTNADSLARRPDEDAKQQTSVPMSGEQLSYYANRAGVKYPSTNGADLYAICALIPQVRRESFERGLGDSANIYFAEIAKQGEEPPEPAPDLVDSFVRSGLVSAEELFVGYERAQKSGKGAEFVTILKERNSKAAELVLAWINGNRVNVTAYIPRLI